MIKMTYSHGNPCIDGKNGEEVVESIAIEHEKKRTGGIEKTVRYPTPDILNCAGKGHNEQSEFEDCGGDENCGG